MGLAVCDRDGVLASPLETVRRPNRGQVPVDLERIAAVVADYAALEVIVGLPLSMSGARGAAAQIAVDYATAIAASVAPVPVRLVDERLSSVSAHGQFDAAGVSSRARREVVDQAAAAIILQSALDAERASGDAPGEVVAAP